MIGAEIMNGEQWGEIDLLSYAFPGFDSKWRLDQLLTCLPDRLAFAAGDFKSKPFLVLVVIQLNIAPGEIRYSDRRDHWLIGDVLQPRELDIQLNLRLDVRRND
jgi:hypothetical protein